MHSNQRQIRRWLPLQFALALLVGCLGVLAALPTARSATAAGGSSLRFFGSGDGDIDRVKIPLGPISDGQISSSLPVNVASDFTIEFWMRAAADENTAPNCAANGWYYGNIIIDRDVDGAGDYGDYGVALCEGRIAFGVSVGEDDRLAIGTIPVTDGRWRHIAVTRADGGLLTIYVDGQLDGQTEGPTGPIDYRTDRTTNQPNSDPYLVLGAEKHDYEGSSYYNGFLDDLHISAQVRYISTFAPPTTPHTPDSATVALYRFDEGAGITVGDSSGAPGGPSSGVLMVGGSAGGPVWSSDTPFNASPPEAEPTTEPTAPSTEPSEPTAEPEGAEPTSEPEGAEPTPESEVSEPTPEPASVVAETPATVTPTPNDHPTEPTPTMEPQGSIAINDTIAPSSRAGQHYGPPPPAGVFTPLTWAFMIAGLGLLISLATVLLWRRRA